MEEIERKKRWYVVATMANRELVVEDNLKKRFESSGLQKYVGDTLVVLTKEEKLDKEGKVKGYKEVSLYPGYLFVEVEMTDELWFLIRNTPGVTGFVGSSGKGKKPSPVSEAQMAIVFEKAGVHKGEIITNYEIGDYVKVVGGGFSGIFGDIVNINNELSTVQVSAIMFGRPTTIDVEFSDIEKAERPVSEAEEF